MVVIGFRIFIQECFYWFGVVICPFGVYNVLGGLKMRFGYFGNFVLGLWSG